MKKNLFTRYNSNGKGKDSVKDQKNEIVVRLGNKTMSVNIDDVTFKTSSL